MTFIFFWIQLNIFFRLQKRKAELSYNYCSKYCQGCWVSCAVNFLQFFLLHKCHAKKQCNYKQSKLNWIWAKGWTKTQTLRLMRWLHGTITMVILVSNDFLVWSQSYLFGQNRAIIQNFSNEKTKSIGMNPSHEFVWFADKKFFF